MTDFSGIVIGSPKRKAGAQAGWEGFFPYYAGFPEAFVSEILKQLSLPVNAVIADPWNGSGTTTSASNAFGLPSWGGDVNPAMVIVAKARLLPYTEADSMVPLVQEICRLAGRLEGRVDPEPLEHWFDSQTAATIRSLELSIRRHLIGKLVAEASENRLEHMSTLAAAFYVGLFAVVRSRLLSLRTSNPTWLRKRIEQRFSISKAELYKDYRDKISSMAKSLRVYNNQVVNSYCPSILRVVDTTEAFIRDGVVDLVITSPPYCTRIDYTSATQVELALIQPWFGATADELSRKMIGSVKVPKECPEALDSWGATCKTFLNSVRSHKSKASSGYYYKNHTDYFNKLSRSIKNISGCLKQGGGAIFVVQDSYYKDIHNPLPHIVSEMAAGVGMKEKRRVDFPSRRSLSSVNTRSKLYRVHKEPIESVICFSKEV